MAGCCLQVGVEAMTSKLQATIGIVCGVAQSNTYPYLLVDDGYLLVRYQEDYVPLFVLKDE